MQRVATKRELTAALSFCSVYLVIALILNLRYHNHEFLIYMAVMMLIIAAVLAVYKRAGLSRGVLWGFSFWGLLHLTGGLAPIPDHWHTPDTTGVVYNWRIIPGYLKFDQFVHGFGVGLVTWLCWQALATRTRGHDGKTLRPTLGMLSICATAGMGFGSLNETIEFFAVMILPKTNVGDYENTGWDLVANLVGAILAASIVRIVWSRWNRRAMASGAGQ